MISDIRKNKFKIKTKNSNNYDWSDTKLFINNISNNRIKKDDAVNRLQKLMLF